MKLETVKVKSKQTKEGFVVINKSDLTNKHELYKPASAKTAAATRSGSGGAKAPERTASKKSKSTVK